MCGIKYSALKRVKGRGRAYDIFMVGKLHF